MDIRVECCRSFYCDDTQTPASISSFRFSTYQSYPQEHVLFAPLWKTFWALRVSEALKKPGADD